MREGWYKDSETGDGFVVFGFMDGSVYVVNPSRMGEPLILILVDL